MKRRGAERPIAAMMRISWMMWRGNLNLGLKRDMAAEYCWDGIMLVLNLDEAIICDVCFG